MGMTKQAASKLVDGMVESGYLERSTGSPDGRRKEIGLTERGQALLVAVESIYSDLEQRWAVVVGEDRVERLRTDLEALLWDPATGRLPPSPAASGESSSPMPTRCQPGRAADVRGVRASHLRATTMITIKSLLSTADGGARRHHPSAHRSKPTRKGLPLRFTHRRTLDHACLARPTRLLRRVDSVVPSVWFSTAPRSSPERRQPLAAELGFSETVYVDDPDTAQLQIFHPGRRAALRRTPTCRHRLAAQPPASAAR